MRFKLIFSLGVVWAGAMVVLTLGASSDPNRLITAIDGPALYKAYCATCHGPDGTGHGPMAASLKVAPSDLTRIAERNGGNFPMARVARIIAGEEQAAAAHGTRQMPVWGTIFSQVDRDQDLGRVRVDNLTRYLMSLQTQASAAVR
jgi:mono/diheme cytochrome c family protein